MKAIEFVTTTKPGNMIQIPQEYCSDISGQFRVILLFENKEEVKRKPKKTFNALRIKTKDFKFNREEIYDE